jgi:diguanylate cyclase (GGDEF)-like protein
VVLLNVDRFKNVNESLGPGVGDQLLAAFGRLLLGRVRPNDTVARLSADEFALLLDGIGGHEQAAAVAQAIHDALATPFQLEGHEVYATTSMGIGMRARTHESPEDVLRDAHTALNRAKALGKARHEFFKATMRAGAVARMRMENDLRRAMARHELRLAYQPIVVMEDGRLAGFEALIRWDSKERGLVSPVEFIPIAEETGLIVPIGEWVLREACSQIAAWAAEHPDLSDLVVNVNVSGRQLGPALIAQVDQAILDAGIKPGNLKLEITESVLMENAAAAGDLLRRIKARGVRICIDDFGTGYSSLSQLVRLPVDTMKIDRMFVAAMSKDKDTAEVVRSIVALATSLKLDVVAEGVETEEQRRTLAKLGCTYGQGYLFARPLDGPAVLGMLAPMSRRR